MMFLIVFGSISSQLCESSKILGAKATLLRETFFTVSSGHLMIAVFEALSAGEM